MLMPNNFAAWVRFWLVFSRAAKMWFFSSSARETRSLPAAAGEEADRAAGVAEAEAAGDGLEAGA